MANKNNIEGLQSAETGMIYEFIEKTGEISKKVLVIQNDKRSEDNLVSILMLGTKKGLSDTVPIKFEGDTYYVHCGMLTYCRRVALGKRLAKVSDDSIARIKKNVAYQLGLTDDTNDYKTLYDELLARITGQAKEM